MKKSRKPNGRPITPRNGNDRIYTPDHLARDIVAHFKPSGRILEPCRGGGAFTRVLPGCDWCEIDQGRDFLQVEGHWNWIVTNPPYSQFSQFLRKSLQVSDNVVFLCLINAIYQLARQRIIREAGFGVAEICFVPRPPSPWPQFGLSVGAVWLRRGWGGAIRESRLYPNDPQSGSPLPPPQM